MADLENKLIEEEKLEGDENASEAAPRTAPPYAPRCLDSIWDADCDVQGKKCADSICQACQSG